MLFYRYNKDILVTLIINLTKRIRRRKRASGETVEQVRYVLNWSDPKSGAREQRFFERQKDAQEKRAELVAAYERGSYSASTKSVTIADAVATWLDGKRGVVRPNTLATYEFQARYVVGPFFPADARRATIHSGTGRKPGANSANANSNSNPIELLGRVKVRDLTTRKIREWHKQISDEVSTYSANKAMIILKAAMALAAEDYEFRPPAMPTGLQRQRDKARKNVLTPEQVAIVIAGASQDQERGVYAASPSAARRCGTARCRRSPRPRPARAKSLCRRCCARCCFSGASAAHGKTANSIACFRRMATSALGPCPARTAAAR
jgi:hypothetical protein